MIAWLWLSASWFTQTAKPVFRATVEGFKTNALSVADDFSPMITGAITDKSGVKPPHSK